MANPLTSPRFTNPATASRFQDAMRNIPTIKIGESNRAAVRLLQQALVDVGLAPMLRESVKKYGSPDGIFGNETKAAVVAFQRVHRLHPPEKQPDGKVGTQTLSKLDDLLPFAGAPLPPLGDSLDDIELEESGKRLVLNVLRGPHVMQIDFVYRGQQVNIGWFNLVQTYVSTGRIGIWYDEQLAGQALAIYCPANNHAFAPNRIILPNLHLVTWKQRSVLLHECVHASQDIRGVPISGLLSEGTAYIAQNLYHRLATGQRVKDTSPTADAIHEKANVLVTKILAAESSHQANFTNSEITDLETAITAAGYSAANVPYDGVP